MLKTSWYQVLPRDEHAAAGGAPDLVEQMIRVAAGQELAIKQEGVSINGWAFEPRVYGFRFGNSFGPNRSRATADLHRPLPFRGVANARAGTGVVEGSEISVYVEWHWSCGARACTR